MTYVVAGMRRTGTSMMMHCLKLGGMELFYDRELEATLIENYPHNPNKYYYEICSPGEKELDPEEIKGKCVKIMGIGCLNLSVHPLSVVYMKRNPLAQYESMKHALGMTQTEYELVSNQYVYKLEKAVDSLVVFDYDEVLNDPVWAFHELVANGWPVDPIEAAEGVDRSMKHF